MHEPLSGITVLELTLALQGPAAGVYLRDMGADVIKIAPPTGDAFRYLRGKNNNTPPMRWVLDSSVLIGAKDRCVWIFAQRRDGRSFLDCSRRPMSS